jgi:hypothetical protein
MYKHILCVVRAKWDYIRLQLFIPQPLLSAIRATGKGCYPSRNTKLLPVGKKNR